jgi:hypothetical protein
MDNKEIPVDGPEKDLNKPEEQQQPEVELNEDQPVENIENGAEEGDDEMKRTISKAFTESREKSLKGETGLDGL